jgi:hypothetical protein
MPVVARQDRAQGRKHVLTLLLGRDQARYADILGSSELSTKLLVSQKVEAGERWWQRKL